MVRIDLIITGDTPGDTIAALRLFALGKAAGATPADTDAMTNTPAVDQPETITTASTGHWTDDHVTALWRFLSDDVRDIYRLVAHSNGHTIARDSLLDDVGITVRSLSGRLSSQGHAVRRIRRLHNLSLPHPMSFDNRSDTYRMRPDVADTLVRLNL